MLTTDRSEPKLNEVKDNGQNEAYIVLPEEKRVKFIRPVRYSYVHKGRSVDLGTIESLESQLEGASNFAKEHYTKENGYVAFVRYPESKSPIVGKYIKQEELDAINEKRSHSGGCGALTTMSRSLAETYAADPKFYGATFCIGCEKHLPVGEFVWDGTDQVVGS